MGVFRQFPYSNFHEMNMDEIIKIVKNMLEEWAQYYTTWDDWKTQVTNEWAEMQDFINDYFDNLDVQEEINTKITAMVNSGEFSDIVDPYIPPAVSSWLAEHITQPVGVVIDTSLSVSGACADAKATGDAITDVKNEIDNAVDTFTKEYECIKELSDYTQTGYYYGPIGVVATLRTDAGTTCGWVKIPVETGEQYSISMRGRYNVKAYLLVDENEVVLDYSSENNSAWTNTNANIIIPMGAKYMYCNTVIGTTNIIAPTVWKATLLKPVDINRIPLESKIKMVDTPLTNIYSDITNKLSFDTGAYYNQGSMNYKSETNTDKAYMKVFKGETYRVSGYSYYDGRVVGVLDIDRNVLAVYPSTSGIDLVDEQVINITQDGYLTFTLLTTRSAYFKVEQLCRINNTGNPLYGKKLCVDGDSICYGVGYAGGYAGIIGTENGMTVQNLGVSGATMATGTYEADGVTPRHWICTSVENFDNDGDYYIIEGGFNDVGNSVPIDNESFANAIDTTGVFNTATTCGAMEMMCHNLVTLYEGKKLGFIFPHRINEHPWNYPDATRRVLMKKILVKYGIPFIDLAEVSGMDTAFTSIANTYTKSGDGIHPNQLGYEKYYVPKITAWLKTL